MNDDAPRATSVALPALLEDAARRSAAYLRSLEQRPVRPDPDAVQRLARLDEPLPPGPTDPAGVLALLDEVVSPATMAMAGPRFFGFVIGGALPAALAANWLAGAWDQNAACENHSRRRAGSNRSRYAGCSTCSDCRPTLPARSSPARRWPTSLRWPRRATSVSAARGWNVEADGLFGAPPITVVVGDEAHPTLFKSLGMLGLGRNRVIRVPVDEQGRMRADQLPTLAGPTIVCVQAGNVNTGAFDPFQPHLRLGP